MVTHVPAFNECFREIKSLEISIGRTEEREQKKSVKEDKTDDFKQKDAHMEGEKEAMPFSSLPYEIQKDVLQKFNLNQFRIFNECNSYSKHICDLPSTQIPVENGTLVIQAVLTDEICVLMIKCVRNIEDLKVRFEFSCSKEMFSKMAQVSRLLHLTVDPPRSAILSS